MRRRGLRPMAAASGDGATRCDAGVLKHPRSCDRRVACRLLSADGARRSMLANIQDFLQLMLEAGAPTCTSRRTARRSSACTASSSRSPYPAAHGHRHQEPLLQPAHRGARRRSSRRRASSTSRSASAGCRRFRGNLFLQKGAVGGAFRAIPYETPAARRSSACRPSVMELTKLPRGLVLVTGPDRQRQVDHAGGHDRQDQPRARTSTSSRSRTRSSSSTSTSAASSTSARSSPTRTSFAARAQARAAPGPRHRADRRNARPRDHRGGAGRRRDRPPGVLDPAHQLGRADDQPRHRRLPAAPAGAGARAALAGARRASSRSSSSRARDGKRPRAWRAR